MAKRPFPQLGCLGQGVALASQAASVPSCEFHVETTCPGSLEPHACVSQASLAGHMLAVLLAFQLVRPVQGVPPPAYAGLEARLRGVAAGTVLQPGLVDTWPGLMLLDELLHAARGHFNGLPVALHAPPIPEAAKLAVTRLQVYWVDAAMRGRQTSQMGPEWAQHKARALSAQSLGEQRGGPLSALAGPALLPDGLSKEQHAAFSQCLPSPFDARAVLDDDLAFSVRMMAMLGPCARVWRRLQRRAVLAVAKLFYSWDKALVACMHPAVRAVAFERRPATMTAFAILLRWPDTAIGMRFVQGFKLLGKIEAPGLFRELDCPTGLGGTLESAFGSRARAVIDRLEATVRPDENTQVIAEFTLDEVSKGWASGPYTRKQLDSMFGVSRWLPMKRFAHTQASGKVRPVDEGRSSGHNDLASATETIYNHSPDLVVAAAKQLLAVLHVEFECLPDWAALAFGTCDMASAYRQLPNCPEEAPGTVIAFWHPQCQGVRYTILHAHPFGLAAAVLNFNTVPALATAVSRRCLACAVTHYFDDSGIMDWATARGSAQECVESVYGVFGMTLDPHKQQPMASQRVFLGVLLDFSSFVHQSIMRVDVKPGLRDALSEEIGAILDQNLCTAAQAAKLRGRFSWAASAMFGKCARGGQAPLSQQQHHPRPGKLSPELQEALFFMRALAQYIPAREIDLRAQFSAVAVMYTDGSWEPAEMNAPGLGFVLFQNGMPRPLKGLRQSMTLCFKFLHLGKPKLPLLKRWQCSKAHWPSCHVFKGKILSFLWITKRFAVPSSGVLALVWLVSVCHLLWAAHTLNTFLQHLMSATDCHGRELPTYGRFSRVGACTSCLVCHGLLSALQIFFVRRLR